MLDILRGIESPDFMMLDELDLGESLVSLVAAHKGSSSKSAYKTEEEQALIIRAEDQGEVADRIAAMQKMGKFWLMKKDVQNLKDTYFDTDDRMLKGKKVSIRERIVNGTTFVTIKGANQQYTGDSQKRSEIEVEWTFDIAPAAILALFELESIQVRTTQRRPRFVMKGQEVLAELAIDNVLYEFPNGGSARLHEVEIELIDPDAKLSELTKALQTEVPELQPWKHSKLVTGKAIEFALSVELDEDNTLSDKSFEVITKLVTQL